MRWKGKRGLAICGRRASLGCFFSETSGKDGGSGQRFDFRFSSSSIMSRNLSAVTASGSLLISWTKEASVSNVVTFIPLHLVSPTHQKIY